MSIPPLGPESYGNDKIAGVDDQPTALACGCSLKQVQSEGHRVGCGVPGWMQRHGEEVQVAFTVPVEVVVNLSNGKVTRVVTIDEGISLDMRADDLPDVNTRPNYQQVTADDIRTLAGEIADGPDVEWPAWEAGW